MEGAHWKYPSPDYLETQDITVVKKQPGFSKEIGIFVFFCHFDDKEDRDKNLMQNHLLYDNSASFG